MPTFDFRCEECGNTIEKSLKWTKTMTEDLKPCQCGEQNWKQYITVSRSKFAEPDQDIAVRQADEMMSGKGWH
jgi:putative FmdB family regulatory protein